MAQETESQQTDGEQRWVAFGAAGAVGSIHRTADGFAVRMIDGSQREAVYPTVEVAKSALHAAMAPGSDWPEYREH
jgi:hypothetical protein